MNTKISANQNGHNHPKIVNAYASARSLTKPEAAVLELIATYDHRDAMLDIGIGAGRTIPYFSPLFKSYVGIDYAESMVNYCRSHFDISNAVFQYQDARDLSGFHNDSFDHHISKS